MRQDDALRVLRRSYESMLGKLTDEQWRELVAMVMRQPSQKYTIEPPLADPDPPRAQR